MFLRSPGRDRVLERLDQLSHEIRHSANLRFDTVDGRQLEQEHEIAKLQRGLAETREALVESTAYLTRALREAGRLNPSDPESFHDGSRDESAHGSREIS